MPRTTVLALTIALAGLGCDVQDPLSGELASNSPRADQEPTLSKKGFSNAGLPGRGLVVRLLGTGTGYAAVVPDIDGDGLEDDATCFDIDLLDAGSARVLGTASDCLSNITPVGDGLALVGTTTFNFANGSFVTRGSTTVQPITTTAATPVTHTTGAIPVDGSNGVLSGTGAYSGFAAQVRLSGAVNMSALASEGKITFDCLFAIQPL